MCTVLLASNFYAALAIAVLFLHGLFILWVIFGALLARGRPMLRWLHVASLIWGILTELLPWPCPLTVARFLGAFKMWQVSLFPELDNWSVGLRKVASNRIGRIDGESARIPPWKRDANVCWRL